MNKFCYDTLSALYEHRSFAVPCLIGPPGIGKTEAVYELAKDIGVNVVELIASQCNPTEVAGFVMPDNETGEAVIYDPHRLRELKDGDILFFDELLQAPQSVLSACLTIIEERRLMSGYKLPDIFICAAANPTVSSSVVQLPIRQRFMFIEANYNEQQFACYIANKYDFDYDTVKGRLCNLIQLQGEDWNVLTPRLFEKLLKLVLDGHDNLAHTISPIGSLVSDIRYIIRKSEEIKNQESLAAATSSNVGDMIFAEVVDCCNELGFTNYQGKPIADLGPKFHEMTPGEIIKWIEELPHIQQEAIKKRLEGKEI